MSNDNKQPRYFFGVHGTWPRWIELKRLDREAEEIAQRRGETKHEADADS